MARKHRGNEQEVENTRNRKRNSIRESLQCDWEHCGRLCKAKAGLKAHQRMAQTGHSYKDKLGDKREKKECSVFHKMIVKSNMARHSRIHQQE